MPIDAYYDSSNEEGPTFVVSDEIMVFNRAVADAINHLQNHTQMLVNFATNPYGLSSLDFIVQNHPLLRDYAQRYLDLFRQDEWNLIEMGKIRLEIFLQLKRETQLLVEFCADMAWASSRPMEEGDDEETVDGLDHLIAELPFIDYHNKVEERPSIVRVHEI